MVTGQSCSRWSSLVILQAIDHWCWLHKKGGGREDLGDDDESENCELGVCTQSLVVLAAAPLLLAGMRAHTNLTPTTLFIIAPSAFLSHFQVGQTCQKKCRYLQLRGTQQQCVPDDAPTPHGAFFTLWRVYSIEPPSSTDPFVPSLPLWPLFPAHLYCLPLASVKADRHIFWGSFQALVISVFWAFYGYSYQTEEGKSICSEDENSWGWTVCFRRSSSTSRDGCGRTGRRARCPPWGWTSTWASYQMWRKNWRKNFLSTISTRISSITTSGPTDTSFVNSWLF